MVRRSELDHRRDRDDIAVLVWEEAEDATSDELVGSVLHLADRQITELHGPRELAVLKGRAHPVGDRGRHPSGVDEQLGAAADAGVQGADQHLVRLAVPRRDAARSSPCPGATVQ